MLQQWNCFAHLLAAREFASIRSDVCMVFLQLFNYLKVVDGE